MQCAACGARAIEGAAKCYRCERPFAAAATDEFGVAAAPRPTGGVRQVSHPRPAPAVPLRSPRLAPWATFALAVLAVGDGLLLSDGVPALVASALLVALGVALLRRRAWWAGVLAHGSIALLALVALLAAPLVGLVALLCASLALVGLLRPSSRVIWRGGSPA